MRTFLGNKEANQKQLVDKDQTEDSDNKETRRHQQIGPFQ